MTFLRAAIGQTSINIWNDAHTHDAVLDAFDRAIELAKVTP